jgi:hypothetical protein
MTATGATPSERQRRPRAVGVLTSATSTLSEQLVLQSELANRAFRLGETPFEIGIRPDTVGLVFASSMAFSACSRHRLKLVSPPATRDTPR